MARIEPRTRRWYRGQHHGSAGTFILKTVTLKLEGLNFLRSLISSIRVDRFFRKIFRLKEIKPPYSYVNEFAKDRAGINEILKKVDTPVL